MRFQGPVAAERLLFTSLSAWTADSKHTAQWVQCVPPCDFKASRMWKFSSIQQDTSRYTGYLNVKYQYADQLPYTPVPICQLAHISHLAVNDVRRPHGSIGTDFSSTAINKCPVSENDLISIPRCHTWRDQASGDRWATRCNPRISLITVQYFLS